jgi:hypothetical protein
LFTQHKAFTGNKTEVAEKSAGSWPTEGKNSLGKWKENLKNVNDDVFQIFYLLLILYMQ